MKRSALWTCGALLALWGCSGAQEKRLADGAWHIRCGEAMSRCTNRADALCGDRGYQVLGGGTQGTVLGGPSSYRTRVESSELVVRCGQAAADEEAEPPALSRGTSAAGSKQVEPTRAAPLCIPGATQACVGPGGCTGGQACLPDGLGYAACDCGSPAPLEAPSQEAPSQGSGLSGAPVAEPGGADL